MVSATRDKPYPGESPASWPGMWSVNTNTSASIAFSTPRAPSTILLLAAGATRMLYAMPRTRFTMPAARRTGFQSCSESLLQPPCPCFRLLLGMHWLLPMLAQARHSACYGGNVCAGNAACQQKVHLLLGG